MAHDKFGFQFWLGWILWFVLSLVLASLLWTIALSKMFGKIAGIELTLTWALSVFGSWFMLLTPFMRKKEQIWKRLNRDQEKAVDAWLCGMGIFIGLLMASALFWDFIFRGRIASKGLDGGWAKAVLGTWLLSLLPFLVWMYRQADQIFQSAVSRQLRTGPHYRATLVEKSKRILPENVAAKISRFTPSLKDGHVVSLLLKDGRRIPNIFVLNSKEILGIYDRSELGFEGEEVTDAEVMDQLPAYEEEKWLRLDGRA